MAEASCVAASAASAGGHAVPVSLFITPSLHINNSLPRHSLLPAVAETQTSKCNKKFTEQETRPEKFRYKSLSGLKLHKCTT